MLGHLVLIYAEPQAPLHVGRQQVLFYYLANAGGTQLQKPIGFSCTGLKRRELKVTTYGCSLYQKSLKFYEKIFLIWRMLS